MKIFFLTGISILALLICKLTFFAPWINIFLVVFFLLACAKKFSKLIKIGWNLLYTRCTQVLLLYIYIHNLGILNYIFLNKHENKITLEINNNGNGLTNGYEIVKGWAWFSHGMLAKQGPYHHVLDSNKVNIDPTHNICTLLVVTSIMIKSSPSYDHGLQAWGLSTILKKSLFAFFLCYPSNKLYHCM